MRYHKAQLYPQMLFNIYMKMFYLGEVVRGLRLRFHQPVLTRAQFQTSVHSDKMLPAGNSRIDRIGETYSVPPAGIRANATNSCLPRGLKDWNISSAITKQLHTHPDICPGSHRHPPKLKRITYVFV